MLDNIAVLFVLGGVLLVGGAELLVRGASRLAVAMGISPLVVGLTVVAFGTSSPELAVTVQASWSGQADVALGNVVGSNIFNVLLILGLSALIVPLTVAHQLVRLDVPLMIGASVVMLLMALDGTVGRAEGALLFAGVVVYTVFLIRQSRRATAADKAASVTAVGVMEPAPRGAGWLINGLLVVVGLGLLVLGSRWLVAGAVRAATALGVSELVIGLTIVSAGTSLPEVATSVMASIRGERDIAVGNVVGSNLFNILAVLGLGSLVAPGGVAVAHSALTFDIPVMIGVAIACLPIFFTGYVIARWEGAVFLGYYAVYVAYQVLSARSSQWTPALAHAMFYFVIPLTGLTLLVVCLKALRRPAVAD